MILLLLSTIGFHLKVLGAQDHQLLGKQEGNNRRMVSTIAPQTQTDGQVVNLILTQFLSVPHFTSAKMGPGHTCTTSSAANMLRNSQLDHCLQRCQVQVLPGQLEDHQTVGHISNHPKVMFKIPKTEQLTSRKARPSLHCWCYSDVPLAALGY